MQDKDLIRSYARLKRSLATDKSAVAVAATTEYLPAPTGKKARLQTIISGARLEDKTEEELEAYLGGGATDEDPEAEDGSIFGRVNKETMNICTTTRDDPEEECPLFSDIDTPLE